MELKWKNGTKTQVTVEGEQVTVVDISAGHVRTRTYSPDELLDLVAEHNELNKILLTAAARCGNDKGE